MERVKTYFFSGAYCYYSVPLCATLAGLQRLAEGLQLAMGWINSSRQVFVRCTMDGGLAWGRASADWLIKHKLTIAQRN